MSISSAEGIPTEQRCAARLEYLRVWAMREVHSSGYDDYSISGLPEVGLTDCMGGDSSSDRVPLIFLHGNQIPIPSLPEDRDD